MLHYLLTQEEVSSCWYRDGFLYFTALNDGATLAGSSYRSTACNDQRALAWYEEGCAAMFAHKLGHMLGALHNDKDIIKPILGWRSLGRFPLALEPQSSVLLKAIFCLGVSAAPSRIIGLHCSLIPFERPTWQATQPFTQKKV